MEKRRPLRYELMRQTEDINMKHEQSQRRTERNIGLVVGAAITIAGATVMSCFSDSINDHYNKVNYGTEIRSE